MSINRPIAGRLLIVLAIVVAPLSAARATVIAVNSIQDASGVAGVCTLRDAIIAANSNAASGGCPAGSPYPASDSITIQQSRQFCLLNPCTFLLSSTLPTIVEDVTISGTGTWVPTINGQSAVRIFDLGSTTVGITRVNLINGSGVGLSTAGYGGAIRTSSLGTTLSLSGIYFGNNHAQTRGGAIYLQAGTVTVDNCTFNANTSDTFGGAIDHIGGVLIVTNSTFSGNSASDGGAIEIQGAADTRLTNVTISGNGASNDGGGIARIGTTNNTTMNNVTITANTADSNNDGFGSGGGIRRGGGNVLLSNSVIAGNFDTPNNAGTGTISPDCRWDNGGGVTSFGYNLLGKGDGCAGLVDGVSGDRVGTIAAPVNALLGPLTGNGGPTATHALLAGSPGIDAGNPSPPGIGACATADQRGVARPINGRCDMGAYESPLDDADRDGILDPSDDCIYEANGPAIPDAGGGSQRDADGDGYGNACDADLNQSGLTTSADFNLMRTVLNQSSGAGALQAAADMNGSGLVTSADYNLLRQRINTSPGPSGLVP